MDEIASFMPLKYALTSHYILEGSERTKGKLHLFIWDGHVIKLEINLSDNNSKVLELLPKLSCLNFLIIHGSFTSEKLRKKLRNIGFKEEYNDSNFWYRENDLYRRFRSNKYLEDLI